MLTTFTRESGNFSRHIERRFLFANGSNTLFLFVRDIVAYTTLIAMVVNGTINITMFVFLTGIVTGFSKWLNEFIESSNNIRKVNIAVNKFRNCIEMETSDIIDEGIDASVIENPIKIEFRDVTFTYAEAEEPTLKKLSFILNAGEKVALVGNNGAGKTTIVKLLSGLYSVDSGEILINETPISKISRKSYMDLFSVVFQDSEPLSLTIKHNIGCSRLDDIDESKMWGSLEKAGLKEKVESFEQKEYTYITQMFEKTGVRLSGGEIQKLMLARALYKEAPVLILDEPTAALDPLAEESMYLKYNDFTKGNTSLFISHRLSSTKFCDKILFLEDGVITEQGSHKELMALSSTYKELFDTQSQYYKEDQIDGKDEF